MIMYRTLKTSILLLFLGLFAQSAFGQIVKNYTINSKSKENISFDIATPESKIDYYIKKFEINKKDLFQIDVTNGMATIKIERGITARNLHHYFELINVKIDPKTLEEILNNFENE